MTKHINDRNSKTEQCTCPIDLDVSRLLKESQQYGHVTRGAFKNTVSFLIFSQNSDYFLIAQ
jgi:thiamine biosynthesis lipoprotein ApbE